MEEALEQNSMSMKKRIHYHLVMMTLLTIILSTMACLSITYRFYDQSTKDSLMTETRALTYGLSENEDPAGYLTSFMARENSEERYHVRATLIRTVDGTVLYDSDSDASGMETHLNRKEIEEAIQSGEGSDTRESHTIGQKTFYTAVLSKNSAYVIRLSREMSGISGMFFRIIPYILFLAIVIFFAEARISEAITERIVKPLDRMAERIRNSNLPMSSIDGSEVYEEIRPFMESVSFAQRVREEFSANVSHELKTPLTSISGFAELMKNGVVGSSKEVIEFSTTIYNESQRLLNLIDDIMRLSRIEEGGDDSSEREDVDLYELSDQILKRLEDKADNARIRMNLSGEHVTVKGNPTMLEEMIFNLVDNSIKYNHPGGHVYVFCGESGISVQDDGIGIAPEHQNRVWERFYRVDKSHSRAIGGTGLGLSIVKHVAEHHHAVVELNSQPGRGTKITVTFPKEKKTA